MPQSNVVITGSGVVSSIGIGSESFFNALLQSRSGITSLADRTDEGAKPHEDSEPAGLWIGGPIVDFEPKQFVRPRKAMKVMCREIQTAFAASQLAIEDAGLSDVLPADPEGELKPLDVGTVFGSEMFYGPSSEMEDAIRSCMLEDGGFDAAGFGNIAMKKVIPLWMLKYLPNMPACHVGIAIGAHGPNNSLVLGDVSGPAALIEAASCIDRGIAKVMLAGATGTRINTTRLNYSGDLPFPDVSDPISMSSRPHDPESKGVVGGEGAATLVLESVEHARARGAKPIARVVAYARRFIPSGGMRQALRSCELTPADIRDSREAIQSAVEGAMRDADLEPDQIGLAVSHAMGDPVSDAAELAAMRQTLPGVPTVATIGALGHTGAACGTIDLATAALALARKTVPPTVGAESAIDDAGLRSRPEPLQTSHVLCLSHNSDGNAVVTILAQP